MSDYYPGHQESVEQSCGASDPAVGVSGSGSVCDQCARLSVWPGREFGIETPRRNA